MGEGFACNSGCPWRPEGKQWFWAAWREYQSQVLCESRVCPELLSCFSSNHSQILDPFYSKATVCWMWWLLPVILVLRNQGKRIMSSRPVLAIYGVQGATGLHGTTVLTTRRTVAMWALILVHPLRKCTLSFCLFAFLSLVCQTWNLVSEVYSVSTKELPASCIQVLAASLTISVFSVDL